MSNKNSDTCFYSFTEPAQAQGDLRALLPSHIVAAADWGTCEALPAGLVAARRKAQHADRLFRARAGDTWIHVYLLLVSAHPEDRWLALDLLISIGTIWERHLSQHPGASRLPPVIPVVLYHGKERWPGIPRFSALYDRETRRLCAEYLLDFEFLIHHAMDQR